MPSNPIKKIGKLADNLQISATRLHTGLSEVTSDLQSRNTSSFVIDIFAPWTTEVSDAEFAAWLQGDADRLYEWCCGLRYPAFEEKFMALHRANSIVVSAKKLRLDLDDADVGLANMQRDLKLDDEFYYFIMGKEGRTEAEIQAERAKRARRAAEASASGSDSGSSGRGASGA